MKLSTYEAAHGEEIDFDLDSVTDVVEGHSGLRPGWQALVVYDPATDAFIELGSRIAERHEVAPELHGGPSDYAVEVDDAYLCSNYALTDDQLRAVRQHQAEWALIHLSAPRD